MAFGFVQQTTGSEITGTGSYAGTPFIGNVVVGNTILVIIADDGGNLGQVTNVTDNLGNTYVKDHNVVNSGLAGVTIYRAPVTVGGSCTITVTYNAASSNNNSFVAQEWSSAAAFTKDQIGSGTGTTSTTPTTSASPATTQSNELVVGGFGNSGAVTTFTAGSGYSNAGSVFVSGAGCAMESKTVSVTGTQVANGTYAVGRTYAAALVTYYEAGAVGTVIPPSNLPLLGVG